MRNEDGGGCLAVVVGRGWLIRGSWLGEKLGWCVHPLTLLNAVRGFEEGGPDAVCASHLLFPFTL
jgi:hypothetical protein